MSKGAERSRISMEHDVLDNDTEFNANQFKLYDDFTTDLRIAFNPLRRNFHDITRTDMLRRRGDPNDSGVDMENGNPLEDVSTSNDSDLVSIRRSRLVAIVFSVFFVFNFEELKVLFTVFISILPTCVSMYATAPYAFNHTA